MYIIGLVVGLVYLALWAMARREPIPEGQKEISRLLIPFFHMAAWCLRVVYSRKTSPMGRRGFVSRKVKADMEKLHLGIKVDALVERYYVEKLALVLVIALTGTVLGILVSWQAQKNSLLKEENQITRGDYRLPASKVELEADLDGYSTQKFSLEINGYIPDKEEVDQLEIVFWEAMCKKALGENVSWNEIRSDLCLETTLDGYPFSVEWTSANPYVVDDNGLVRQPEEAGSVSAERDRVEKDNTGATGGEICQSVELTAIVSCNQWEWTHILELTVRPALLSEEERLYQELQEFLIFSESESREEAVFLLPGEWHNQEIHWTEKVEDYGIVLWALALVTAAAIFMMKDKDLHAQVQSRQRQIRDSYPTIVNKLELYLGAGLTIRGAFERIAEDYRMELLEGGSTQPAYEEILYTCRELRTGTGESEAYERFGRRCGAQEYIRLGAMLSQNLKKGSTALLVRQREETDNAIREQINRSRQIGEEASTKLLVPMIMMLGIVMVVIMIPAFGNM
ncbi:MAG: hypothetical protein IJZ34_05420 [Lachnospiraceae bacterium]|nr:hypothetical protein [Lachnospiraceae bacterium]